MIYVVMNGLSSTDTFRVEVKITYEFVPAATFKVWADTEGPRALLKDQQLLKDVVINVPVI
jgi:hypothetical protein